MLGLYEKAGKKGGKMKQSKELTAIVNILKEIEKDFQINKFSWENGFYTEISFKPKESDKDGRRTTKL